MVHSSLRSYLTLVHSGLIAIWYGPFWSSDCWVWFHSCLRNSAGINTGPLSRFARALKRISQTNTSYTLVSKSCPICFRKDDAKQIQFLHHDGFQYMYIVTFPSSLVYSFLVYFFLFWSSILVSFLSAQHSGWHLLIFMFCNCQLLCSHCCGQCPVSYSGSEVPRKNVFVGSLMCVYVYTRWN